MSEFIKSFAGRFGGPWYKIFLFLNHLAAHAVGGVGAIVIFNWSEGHLHDHEGWDLVWFTLHPDRIASYAELPIFIAFLISGTWSGIHAVRQLK